MILYLLLNSEEPDYGYVINDELTDVELQQLNHVYYIYRISSAVGIVEELPYGAGKEGFKTIETVSKEHLLGT